MTDDLQGWTPKKVTSTGAETIEVNNGPGMVARLYAATEGVSVKILDGVADVWPALVGVDEDEFYNAPLQCNTNISLQFDGIGTAYILYR